MLEHKSLTIHSRKGALIKHCCFLQMEMLEFLIIVHIGVFK